MRSLLVAAALLVACARPAVAAPTGWQWENPRPQGSPIAAMVARGGLVHAVGGHGAALRSRDGGRSWTVATTGVTEDLAAVVAGGTAIHAVGARGTILRSTDGGATFAARPSPTRNPLVAVALAPGGRLYALDEGGALLRSDDGGDSYAVLPRDAPSGHTMAAPTDRVVLIGSPDGLFRSDDGGDRFASKPALQTPIARVFADDAGIVYAIGATRVRYRTIQICNSCVDAEYQTLTLYRSRDAGLTWEQRDLIDPAVAALAPGWHALQSSTPPSVPPSSARFVGGFGGFHPPFVEPRWWLPAAAIGPGGELYVADDAGLLISTDGGATFATRALDRSNALAAISGAIVAAGGATLRRSTDAGVSWTPTSAALADGDNLFAIAVTPAGRAIAVGMNGLLLTRAVHGWKPIAAGDARLDDVAVDGATVIAVGDAGTILRSTDGGRTFAPRASGTTANLQAVWGARGVFFVAGGDGVMLRSRDRGATWLPLPSLTTDAGISLWGSSPTDVYLVTINGQRLHSIDRGLTWRDVSAGTTGVITRVWGTGPRDVYLLGDKGRLFHSDDHGVTWSPRVTRASDELADLWGPNPDELYLAGRLDGGPGFLLRSIDRGVTWTPEPTPTSAPLFAITGGAGSLYLVGEGAQLLRRPL